MAGASTRTCQVIGQSAQWSDTAPQCNRKSCKLTLNGCISVSPRLLAINCGPLSAPKGGSVVVTSTSFQGIATYACNQGFAMIGVSPRQCQANKAWSGSAPICQSKISNAIKFWPDACILTLLPSIVLDCGSLPDPSNGAVQVSTTTVGGQATYQCNTGFVLVGATTRTCQASGLSAQWSDSAPQCNRESMTLFVDQLL